MKRLAPVLVVLFAGLVLFGYFQKRIAPPDARPNTLSDSASGTSPDADAETHGRATSDALDALPNSQNPTPLRGEIAVDRRKEKAGQAPLPGEIVAPASRNVTPPGVTSGPEITGPLVRVAPAVREPSPLAAKPPPPRRTKLFGTTVQPDGRIAGGEATFALAGISLSAPDDTCGSGSEAWPCGRVAIAQLRRLIRGRALECAAVEGTTSVAEPARCTVGGTDLAEWMVRTGWARAAAPALEAMEKDAREAERGLWSPRRP